ncbi:hypothetical protein K439DRAFT_1643115, partial [Ramaria rubella]
NLNNPHPPSQDMHSLPLPPRTTHPVPVASIHSSPLSHTHTFFVLERTFPTPVAHAFMRATLGLLQACLFRAILTMCTRNESAKLQASMAALGREVDALDGKMKEDIQTLKHEVQMEVANRKNAARTDLKQQDITVESIVSLDTLRTEMEKVKWDNMRQAGVYLALFAIFIVVGMEISGLSSRPRPSPLPPSSTILPSMFHDKYSGDPEPLEGKEQVT